MTKARANSTLYRLIAAGQLTHRALALPLRARGLEPGDDAILFLVAEGEGLGVAELGEATGLGEEALGVRIGRLIAHGLVRRRAIGAELAPMVSPTEAGRALIGVLEGTWDALEEALLEDLKPAQRKALRKGLKRLMTLLSAE
ncbi:MarR family transcriptional regulator [Arsenicitalea aurantiaca]|uniref:MarR family transcriptional regulator n=1 Tax=Arsenicitalea aurantiaca TaxID=1783274 RepID=A0A433XK41_9HYPH|nr:MarR family winged helix-turn-helix transcriptional regulator [Arsenicitalea aurantiaca]RUT34451.1 MarR family transcriptional regulator [Arsenicitalea aurantiaca]